MKEPLDPELLGVLDDGLLDDGLLDEGLLDDGLLDDGLLDEGIELLGRLELDDDGLELLDELEDELGADELDELVTTQQHG